MRWWFGVLAATVLAGTAQAQWTEAEQDGLDQALLISNLRRSDFSFPRSPFVASALESVITSIQQPFDSAGNLMRLHASGGEAPADLVQRALVEGLGAEPSREAMAVSGADPSAERLPAGPIRESVSRLAAALTLHDQAVRDALSALTPAEVRTLVEGLPVWAAAEPKATFEFVRSDPSPPKDLAALVARVNRAAILKAGHALARVVQEEVARLKTAREDLPTALRLRFGQMIVEVAGRGPNLHTSTDARLVIDLGGDDIYQGRAGAGIGYGGILIDLGGRDRVETRDLSVGAGLLGTGIAWFAGIDSDKFETGSASLGTGFAGLGLFVREGGDDSYRSGVVSQGHGHLGVGIFLDMSGDDDYSIPLMGQGAGRVGGMGWLIDRAGRDRYRAGGLSVAAPLFARATQSFAQGFGMGDREDSGGRAGGIGLLTDLGGDDIYQAGTYAQAASYWLALGSLYDAEGDDQYSAHHYAQSSAMHICGAYLFDLAGDDFYAIRVGAGHAIGHDYGTALLFDRSGDDSYSSRDSNPGVATANGAAVFFDAAGVDRYGGPSGLGRPSRGVGSLALFIDAAGADLYRTGLADGLAAVRPGGGSAWDQADPPPAAASAPAQAVWPEVGSEPDPGPEALADLYRKATQWGVGTAEAEVQASLRRLSAIGMPAWQWMLDSRLAGADRLQLRAFYALAPRLGGPGEAALIQKLASPNPLEVQNAIRVASEARLASLAPLL
ncbi:MAG: hypothetical protein MH204_03540, partial [Fimbriimonadaceae bacterium]|nr:hypothetical protein [Fimbriimonadaceae bacterium]